MLWERKREIEKSFSYFIFIFITIRSLFDVLKLYLNFNFMCIYETIKNIEEEIWYIKNDINYELKNIYKKWTFWIYLTCIEGEVKKWGS